MGEYLTPQQYWRLLATALALAAASLVVPAVGPAEAHFADACEADVTGRTESAVAYEVGCTSDVSAPHDVEEVTLRSARQPFTAVQIRNPAGNSSSCAISGTSARCVAPPETAGLVYVSAQFAGTLACGTRQASYMTVGAIYGDTTFTSLGPELKNANDYKNFPETAGPCYAQSVDVVEVGPEKARVGKRTCFRFELGLGFTPTGYEPPFRRGQKESLEGGVLRFAGRRAEQFDVDNRDFGFETRVCKRFNDPGRYKAKLTKPSSGDVFHFSGLTQTVKVRR